MDIMYSALANPTVCHIKTSCSIAGQEVPAEVGLERDSDVPVRESTENGQFVFVFMAYDDGGSCFYCLNL